MNFYGVCLAIFAICLLNLPSNQMYAQEVKKNRVRISVDYVKIMDAEIIFNIKASARVNNEPVRVSDADLALVNEIGEEEVPLGTVTTDMNGESQFTLKGINAIRPDSTNTYTVSVMFAGNDLYKKASKSISFKDAIIEAEVQSKDSINLVSAILLDAVTLEPIPGQNMKVQVQRLFRPLGIGDPFNKTDEAGSILVPVEDGIPAVDGNLILEVVLSDSDDYGTVKKILPASIGVPFEEESTFDQRTMWSPRNKTPLFLLIFPNLVTLFMWGFIFYLIVNLFKIVKS